MIKIAVDTTKVAKMARALPRQIARAAELSIDYTAKYIQAEEKREILKAFVSPVDYTINSVKTTLTNGHNMMASVWVATPPRMEQSYLVPQVEGGARKLKGFERGFDNDEFVPASGAKLNAYGNIPVATIKRARAGVQMERSSFFRLATKRGKLWPGVYQRTKTTRGFAARKGSGNLVQRGRGRGRFSSAIQARGIVPIMLEGRTGHRVKPQFDLFGVARRTFDARFVAKFTATLSSMVGR